jgi:cation transport regulator ChaC
MTWIFGYGSLIWKADFPYKTRKAGFIKGYVRRFWQQSTDHRGTDKNPGRVVTLIPFEEWKEFETFDPHPSDGIVFGTVYELRPEQEKSVFEYLDFREKCGYEMQSVEVNVQGELIDAFVYIGPTKNDMFVSPQESSWNDLVQTIKYTIGPSGPNSEYALRLIHALHEMNGLDEHLIALETALITLDN